MVAYIIFSLFIFLFILNGFLRSYYKELIDAIFVVIILISVGFGIYLNGWHSIIYFVIILIFGGNYILTPIAKIVARKLLK
jgi:hypothetical protein